MTSRMVFLWVWGLWVIQNVSHKCRGRARRSARAVAQPGKRLAFPEDLTPRRARSDAPYQLRDGFSASSQGPQAVGFVEAFGGARSVNDQCWVGRGDRSGLVFVCRRGSRFLVISCRRLGVQSWWWVEVHR